MIKQIIVLCLLSIYTQSPLYSQEINQFDSDGLRNGTWEKFYKGTKQLRYSGTFDHGKEIGSFKFYDKKGGHPTAIKTYTVGRDTIDVKFYTNSGNLINSGFMLGRNKEGNWFYYHSDGVSIMTKEAYRNNKLEGEQLVYFENGNIAQKTYYQNGLKEGKQLYFNENGVILKEFGYVNDLLDGPAKLYNPDGTLSKEGVYRANRKYGVWNYYKNGKLDKKVKFPQNKIGVTN